MKDETGYRVGSPFAAASDSDMASEAEAAINGSTGNSAARPAARQGPESLDEGVWGQTAEAALLASALLTLFAIAGLLIFPAGGLTVAGLGVSLAIMGTSPRHRFASTAALVSHLALTLACYWRM